MSKHVSIFLAGRRNKITNIGQRILCTLVKGYFDVTASDRRPAVYAPFPGSPLFAARSTMLISARRSRRQSSRLMFCSTIV